MKAQYLDEEIFDRKTKNYINGATKGDLLNTIYRFRKDIFLLLYTFVLSFINYPSESVFSTWIILLIEIVSYILYIVLNTINSRNSRKNIRLNNKNESSRFCEELVDKNIGDDTVSCYKILLSMTYIVVIILSSLIRNNKILLLSGFESVFFMMSIAYYEIYGGFFNGIKIITQLPKESRTKDTLIWLLFFGFAIYKFIDTLGNLNTFIAWIS